MSNIPIMENGSSARKMDLDPKRAVAVVPLPPFVFTETVTVGKAVPFIVHGFGEAEQLEPTGPEQVNVIEPLKPLDGATERL